MDEHYIVSARKYRPSTFASVVGQKALISTLKNAVATDRLAHAYLFCGSRGVGKTSTARIFAKTINCSHRTPDGEACNECESCRQFNNGQSLNVIELDAASHNGVDDMRGLIEQVMVPPVLGRYRVFIIDEVHMLSASAFNAFLKTLEEPPEYVIFILATTEKHKIIPTILSRCQIYDFNRITVRDMIDHLEYVAGQEGISAERDALAVIARKADGAMRDALSIFDQVAASSRGVITYQSTIDNLNVLDREVYNRLLTAIQAGNVADALLIYKEVRDNGFDSQFFINGLAGYFRDLMVARDPRTSTLLDSSEEAATRMAQLAAACTPQFLYKAMELCNDADLRYRESSNKQLLIELVLIKLCQADSPSPNNSGDGEGQLKPLRPTQPSQAPQPKATAAPAAAAPAAPAAPKPPVTAAPRAAAPAPAVRPADAPGRSIRISMHRAGDQTDAAAEEAAPAATKNRRTAYTPEELQKAWADYIAAHPADKLLVQTMRMAPPTPGADGALVAVVQSPQQVAIMNEALPDILAFLSEYLQNDDLTLLVELNQDEAPPQTWSSAEVLHHIASRSEETAQFIREFKLTL